MYNSVEEAFNQIDKAIFSNTFLNIKNLAKLRYYIERWGKETMGCNRCKYEQSYMGNCTNCRKAYENKPNNFTLKEKGEEDEPSFR